MRGKRVLLGVTGGIAAYKIAYLIRILKKQGAEVKCVMTPASSDFISPLVVSTLSGNPVNIDFWNRATGEWTNHVELALWADVFLVAPLTANSLSAMAVGGCDNLLLACYLSMKTKTIVAPAMDLDMYAHPTTRRNLEAIQKDGVEVIPAESGELASGLEGEGRMAEPEQIAQYVSDYFSASTSTFFTGKRVLITAGPTYEAIDPVRYIGNHSSGKMGYALAKEALNQGAEVVLISGPTDLKLQHSRLTLVNVVSAQEMLLSVQKCWGECHVGIFSAAVADFRPSESAAQKIKKEKADMVLNLVKNPDILLWAGENKTSDQLLVGFALETENLLENGRKKLENKHLNLIVLNSGNEQGAGFFVDTNKVHVLDDRNNLTSFELKTKAEVAKDILDKISLYAC